jgi:sterol desaturase/sphingolipid hydroxylase (fatty acid hydroxylase superfamily)
MPPVLVNLVASFTAFGLLARMSPCNPTGRPFVSRDLADNALYWVVGVLFFGELATIYITFGARLLFGGEGTALAAGALGGFGPASRLPLPLQAALVIVAMDFVQYWLHRLFHTEWLWPFHAIHHSAEDLDWSATYRIHPVNLAIYGAGAIAIIHLAGFSSVAFLIVGPFNLVVGALVHANLNWTFGPLRFVFASPVYHRWHHVRDPALHNKNFAPTFPIFDLIFGTYHMPKGELPSGYGVEGVPPHFFLQLLWPFQAIYEKLRAALNAGARQPAV